MSVQRPGVFNSFQLQTAPPFVRLMAKEVTCEYRIICTKIETKGGKRRMVLEGHSLRGLFSPPLTYEERGKGKGERGEWRKEWMNQSINKLERRHYDVSDWAETGGYFVDMMFPSKVQHPLIEWHFVSLVSDHKRRTRGIASKKRNMTWHPLKEKPNLKSPWKKNQSPLLHQHHLKPQGTWKYSHIKTNIQLTYRYITVHIIRLYAILIFALHCNRFIHIHSIHLLLATS